MEEATSHIYDMEEASTTNKSLDYETRNKRLALLLSNVSTIRVGVVSSHIEQMKPLEKMDLHWLKEDTENEDDFYTHACTHCDTLLRTALKLSTSNKSASGLSFHHVNSMRHLD